MPHLPLRSVRIALIALSGLALSCDGDFDLVVDLVGAPAALHPGDAFAAGVRVCNRGVDPSGPDTLELWLRPPDAGGDVLLGSHPVPPLDPGQCHTGEESLVAPSGLLDGAYRLLGRLPTSGHERLSAAFGLGYLPDLRVEELQAPASAEPGSSFDVRARVCNRGTEWAPGTSLPLYLSDDLVLAGAAGPAPDVPAGSLPVPGLPPGSCAPVEGTASAPVPGDLAYLLLAIVDEAGSVAELMEENNLRVTPIGVGYGADLVVRSLSAPGSSWNGGSFEARALVCNQGTAPAPPFDVTFFFSEDAVIEPPTPEDPAAGDFGLGALPVPPLVPGACEPVVGSLDAVVPSEGAWILGAVVDEEGGIPELIENNNALAGPWMGVGNGPDLVAETLAAPPSAEPGVGFDATVAVCNRGTAPADPSEVRIFLSADASLDPMPLGPDPDVGSAPVPPIPPAACVDVAVPALADGSLSGAVRVFARTDAQEVVAELLESNNDTAGPWLGVGLGPDLVLSSLVAPPSVLAGAEFDVEVGLCNQGTLPSPPTSVLLFHSDDDEIDPAVGLDLYAGELFLADPLPPGVCRTLAGTGWSDGSAQGAYFLGAVVDEPDFVEELQEANNRLTGPVMGVGNGPDLVVTRLEGPPSAFPGSEISLDFEVCNQGTAPSAPSHVTFYDSADNVIAGEPPPPLVGDDRWLGDEPLPGLPPGSCQAGSALVWVPSGEVGERTLGAIVDPDDSLAELVESNNAFAGEVLGVGNGPDLRVTALAAPASVLAGSPLAVDTQVCNQGTGPSPPAPLDLYLSSDAVIEGGYWAAPPGPDLWLTEVSLPPLAPGECHDELASGPASVPSEGAWYLGGIVDEGGYLVELVESNNTMLGPLLGVGDGPDLVVTSLDVPPSAALGASFPVSAEVCNQGTGASPSAYVTLLHSEDTEITSSFPFPYGPDVPFAVLPVDPLLPGACLVVAGSGSSGVSSEGAWFTGAIVDEEQAVPELVETNNRFLGPLMGLGTGPDLVISVLAAPAPLSVGVAFPADVEVCNQGSDWSPATDVHLFHSTDDALDLPPLLPDTYLTDVVVPALAPGGCQLETKSVDSGVPGPGYLAAVVDEGDSIPELIESNNSRVEALDVSGP